MPETLSSAASGRRRDIFLGALQAGGPVERAAFLDRTCGQDGPVRREIEALLEERERLDDFLETPAFSRPPPPHTGSGTDRPLEAETAARAEAIGDPIGAYRLIEKLGEGGVGIVYRAEQEVPLRRQVALKVIRLGMDTRSVVARFEAERQALALMDHPHIAKVLDAGTTDSGRPYFVMELVRGVRITDYCNQHRLSLHDRLALFLQACQAIQHAHQKGIIHRDIKPSNILVARHDQTPVAKVIDFGIAKAIGQRLTEQTQHTVVTAFLGTPAYMSPEQAGTSSHGGADSDTRTDVYALGVLLYELLTGRTPFDTARLLAAGWEEYHRTLREVEPLPPSARLQQLDPAARQTIASQRQLAPAPLVARVRGDLDWVVMRCLEKDRHRRYPTVSDLAQDLQHYLADEPVAARPPSRLYRCRKFVRRHRVALAGATGIALALVAGSIVSLHLAVRATRAERAALAAQATEQRLRQEAERQHAAAQLNEYVADINLAQQALSAGNLGRALQLIGKHQPAPGEPDLRGFEWRFLWQRCQGDPHVSLPSEADSIQAVAFSPDDRWIALGSRAALTILDRRASAPVHQSSHGAVSLAFHPAGTFLAAAGPQEVRLWQLPDWIPHLLPPGNTAPLALSPDGTRLVTSSRGGLRLWQTTDWTEVRQFPGTFAPMAFSPDGRTLAANSWPGLGLWNVETGTSRLTLESSVNLFLLGGWWFGGGSLLAFSPDGRFLVAPRNRATHRGAFVLSTWDTTSGAEIAVLPEDPERLEHAGIITSVAFSPDGQTLASSSMDHSLRLWDFATRRPRTTLQGHRNEVWALAFSTDGTTLASGSKDGSVKLWATRRESPQDFRPGAARPLAFSPDGQTLAVLTPPATLAFLDAATGAAQRQVTLEPEPFPFRPLWALSADLLLLAEGRPDGAVRLHHLDSGERTVLQASDRPLEVLALSPDARWLLTAGRGQSPRWWDRQHQTHTTLAAAAFHALFSPDHRTLALLERGRTVQLYDTATGTLRARILTDTALAPVAAFARDGTWLATTGAAGAEHIVQLWDPLTGQHRGDCRGHKQGIHAIASSADSRTLATCGDDSTLKLWHVPTQQELLSFQRLGSRPSDLLFSPDGHLLVDSASPCPDTPGLQFYRAPSLAAIAADPQ